MNASVDRFDALARVVDSLDEVAVAVSGGVDSLTLATFVARRKPRTASMFHAVSPAVPAEATERVQRCAEGHGWKLTVIDAGEFTDDSYRSNPLNRCYYCKTNLYGAIAPRTKAQIVSGTNVDDLGEYRPGLDAAKNHNVRHPFVEAGIHKAGVRVLARELGLGEISDLPSAPCLSSRIETGIGIDPAMLALVHETEKLVGSALSPKTVRCRVRAAGVVIELDAETLSRTTDVVRAKLCSHVASSFRNAGFEDRVTFAPYRVGSAFVPIRVAH